MKKAMIISSITIVLAILLSGCSGFRKDSRPVITEEAKNPKTNEQSIPSSSSLAKPEVTLTVPEGWEKKQGAALAQYMKNSSSFIVSYDVVPSQVKSPDEYVEFTKQEFKKTFADAAFSEVKKITVNGTEGRDFTFTASASGLKMKYRIVYLFKNSLAYTVTCGALGEEFETDAPEFQKMIDSLQLK